jgi:hypothetical protein
MMTKRTAKIGYRVQAIASDASETIVRVTFGLFVGSLITLLALLYAGAPIV